MRVVLLGGKHLAVELLRRLHGRAGVDLVAFVPCDFDYEDRGAGPDPDRWYPSALDAAEALGVPAMRTRAPSGDPFVARVAALEPDWLISAQYNRILRASILAVPRHGTLNIHFGLLPRSRGMMPLVWGLIEDGACGVTVHEMDEGIDTGPVILQRQVVLDADTTARTLYESASVTGADLLEELLPAMADGPLRSVPQGAGVSYHGPGYPNERWIDWDSSAEAIDRFVRALTFPPYPAARTILAGREVEVLHPVVTASASGVPGTVLDVASTLTVACASGAIAVSRLRVGGETVEAGAWARAAGVRAGDRLERGAPATEA